MAEGCINFAVACIEPTIADHFKVFFRDMADQSFDEINSGNGFFYVFIIFMTVVMKSDRLLVANAEDLIKNLNPKITGWKNYYTTKTSGKWMMALDQYIICTFTRWYNKKHQRQNRMSRMGFVKKIACIKMA